MNNEAHGDNLNHTLDCEDVGEDLAQLLDQLIVLCQRISIFIVKKGKHDWVDEDEHYDKIIKPWPAR